MLQLQRSRGNFFAVMRPRLQRLNPVKYLNRQELDKDLLYLHKAFENKVPPESEDWRFPYLIDNCKGQVISFKESAAFLIARKKDLISMYRGALVSGFVNIPVYFNKSANNFKPLDRFFKRIKILLVIQTEN